MIAINNIDPDMAAATVPTAGLLNMRPINGDAANMTRLMRIPVPSVTQNTVVAAFSTSCSR